MGKKIRIAGKILLAIICAICLIYLIHKDETQFQLKQPEGEGVLLKDVNILLNALTHGQEDFSPIFGMDSEDNNLNYENYTEILEILLQEDKEELLYRDKYREEFYLLKEDWYRTYDKLLLYYGMDSYITCKEIAVLSGDSNLTEEKVGEGRLLTASGEIYNYYSEAFDECCFQTVRAYVAENSLLTLREKTENEYTLENVWIMETGQDALQIFTKGFEVVCPGDISAQEIVRESIADITFGEGCIQSVKSKQNRIGGKLLRISDTELEIEGKGTFRLYEELKEQGRETLKLGDDFADFVIADGKVCGILILRKENMESIRVAIKTNDFASLYHKEILIEPDCDMELVYGPYADRETKIIRAGEQISFTENSEYLSGDAVMLRPYALSGRTKVLSLERSQGIPSYRGNLQIAKTSNGITLINELLLEEYLYSVVPSEMPASYPMEALKAQALCARTYAYRYLETPGLGEIGAHVDDSVGYQVYNNISENVASTKAVKETMGSILFYDNVPVNTYYYSTSCGFGTDAGVWQEDNVTAYPYLTSMHIERQGSNDERENERLHEQSLMQQEEIMREYLLSVNEQDYECNEPWYRWKYTAEELQVSVLYERLLSRFHADKNKILRLKKDAEKEEGGYESIEPAKFHKVYSIKCGKRRDGGVMDELILKTDNGTYKIISEYNIRYLLNQGGEVTRHNGSSVACGQLLPSAYIVVDMIMENDIVTGYEILGGGYGHGVGMSQNGAKSMAKEGMSSEEIIAYFYPKCEQKQIY